MIVKKNPNELIGKKYDERTYHCWHFIEECLEVATLDDISVSTAKNDIVKYKNMYNEILEPSLYCLVVLGDSHVGIWLNGGVYHNDTGGVRYEPLRVMRLKYNKVRYYDIR